MWQSSVHSHFDLFIASSSKSANLDFNLGQEWFLYHGPIMPLELLVLLLLLANSNCYLSNLTAFCQVVRIRVSFREFS